MHITTSDFIRYCITTSGPERPTITDHEKFRYLNPQGTIFVIAVTGGESIQGVDIETIPCKKSYEGYGCIDLQIDGRQMKLILF